MRISPHGGINRMAKLYVIGGKLPLFTQEASFMESICWENGSFVHFPGEIRLTRDFYLPVCSSLERITTFIRELNSVINYSIFFFLFLKTRFRWISLPQTSYPKNPPPLFTISALTTPSTEPTPRFVILEIMTINRITRNHFHER